MIFNKQFFESQILACRKMKLDPVSDSELNSPRHISKVLASDLELLMVQVKSTFQLTCIGKGFLNKTPIV